MSNNNKNNKTSNNDDSDEDQPPQIPYRRDRTPSIVVQSLGLSFHKDSNITESIELPGDEEDLSQQSNSSDGNTDPKSSTSGIDEPQNASCGPCDSLGGSAKGSLSSLQNTSPGGGAGGAGVLSSPVRGIGVGLGQQVNKPQRPLIPGNNNRRLSLNIGTTAPRRQSLTVDGIASSFINPNSQAYKDLPGNATGSLRNKVALKPGHSLMGWIRLASTAKDLSGTNGKIIEVSPEELAKHDKENDCWVALKGNVYNVTTYLQYHPGGVEELMRGAGADATELFNEVHRWVNYESILAKCLVGPYKLESPLTPIGRGTFVNMTNNNPTTQAANKNATSSSTNRHRDPTIAQKPPRRQSIALTVPSPNKYQSLLLNNNSSTNLNQIQQPPTYVIMQDKSCIKVKIQDLNTLPLIRSRHLICDLNDSMELHVSIILSTDWLYRVHLRLDQKVDEKVLAELSSDDGFITIQLNKKQQSIWNKIGTSMDLNDSLFEMTLADKFFRSCQLFSKKQLTHDTYLFEFRLENTLMYVPIGWHILMREHIATTNKKKNEEQQQDSSSTKTTTENEAKKENDQLNYDRYDDYRVNKNYTPVLSNLLDNDGLTDETGFMNKLYFIIKIYPNGVLTSKLNQLKIGDSVDISDYQSVDFDIENHVMNPKHWFLFAAGTGITPFCRIISYLLNQSDENVKSVTLTFFNKTEKDIIWRDQFDQLAKKHESRFKVIHVLSNVPDQQDDGKADSKSNKDDAGHKLWTGRRGKISKDLMAELVDSHQPDELQFLACGPRAFSQLTKTIANELNLQEKLYIFHG